MSRIRRADANLYMKQQEAAGLFALYKAQSEGIERLMESFGGNQAALVQYMMIKDGIYEKLAQSNAQAIKGLEPKITVWNTNNGKNDNISQPITDIMKMLPPLMTTIHDQTGLKVTDLFVPSKNDDTEINKDNKNIPEYH